MKEIMNDKGISLLEQSGKYYLQYDAGELMIKIKRLLITPAEAKQIIKNYDCAYNIIVQYQERGIFGEDVNGKYFGP